MHRVKINKAEYRCHREGEYGHPYSIKIAHLSDLHGREIGKGQETLIHTVEMIRPDFILCTGDIADKEPKPIENALIALKRLKGIAPVFYSLGNHEQTTKHALLTAYLKELRLEGVHLIRNGFFALNDDCCLYGLEMPVKYYKDPLHGYDKKAVLTVNSMNHYLGTPDRKKLNILMAHDPQWFEAYADWGADIVLSGHIHGGFIYIPGIGGLLSPNVSFFPKYCAGEYDYHNKRLIVSRGLNNKWPFSLTNPSEVVQLTITMGAKSKDAQKK